MNKKIYLFIFFYLFLQVLAVIPEWNLSSAGKDLLGSSSEYTYTINHRYLFNHNMELKKTKLRGTKKEARISDDFTNEVELKPEENFSGENWDLKCYLNENANYLLVFYLMNGSNKNAYLTNSDSKILWYDGITIKDRELFDYLLKSNG